MASGHSLSEAAIEAFADMLKQNRGLRRLGIGCEKLGDRGVHDHSLSLPHAHKDNTHNLSLTHTRAHTLGRIHCSYTSLGGWGARRGIEESGGLSIGQCDLGHGRRLSWLKCSSVFMQFDTRPSFALGRPYCCYIEMRDAKAVMSQDPSWLCLCAKKMGQEGG